MKLKVPRIGRKGLARPSWYTNSWFDLPSSHRSTAGYENTYKVKMILNASGYITHIDFPHKDAATLFVLRWS